MKQAEVGVPAELFAAGGPGAVSREVAEAMARGGLDRSRSDWCLSITGIAGPEGGSEGKPVGTVWIGLAWRQGAQGIGVESRRFAFTGERANVRDWSAKAALAMLRLRLVGSSETRLLRQVD
jgi:PncC family amidohydrolase